MFGDATFHRERIARMIVDGATARHAVEKVSLEFDNPLIKQLFGSLRTRGDRYRRPARPGPRWPKALAEAGAALMLKCARAAGRMAHRRRVPRAWL